MGYEGSASSEFHRHPCARRSQGSRMRIQVLKWYQDRNKPVTPVHPVCFISSPTDVDTLLTILWSLLERNRIGGRYRSEIIE